MVAVPVEQVHQRGQGGGCPFARRERRLVVDGNREPAGRPRRNGPSFHRPTIDAASRATRSWRPGRLSPDECTSQVLVDAGQHLHGARRVPVHPMRCLRCREVPCRRCACPRLVLVGAGREAIEGVSADRLEHPVAGRGSRSCSRRPVSSRRGPRTRSITVSARQRQPSSRPRRHRHRTTCEHRQAAEERSARRVEQVVAPVERLPVASGADPVRLAPRGEHLQRVDRVDRGELFGRQVRQAGRRRARAARGRPSSRRQISTTVGWFDGVRSNPGWAAAARWANRVDRAGLDVVLSRRAGRAARAARPVHPARRVAPGLSPAHGRHGTPPALAHDLGGRQQHVFAVVDDQQRVAIVKCPARQPASGRARLRGRQVTLHGQADDAPSRAAPTRFARDE